MSGLAVPAAFICAPGLACQSAQAANSYAGAFHLEAKESRQIDFDCTIQVETPDERIEKWVLNFPVPPATGSQRITETGFKVKDIPAVWARVKERSAFEREIACAVVGGGGGAPGRIEVTASYAATMFRRKLVAGEPAAAVGDLPDVQRRLFTAPTTTCDYRDATVQSWITKHGLTTSLGETDIQFAARVFQAVQESLQYELPNNEPNFFRCSRSVRTGRGDCGASNLLFAGTLRNSGIPARVYCGRWVVNPHPGGSHSRGEFFARGVGWAPVDATAPGTPGKVQWQNFGTDPGQYLATSLETDWRIELPTFGVQKLTWLHQYLVPYRYNGKRTWDGFKSTDSFSLRQKAG